MIDDRFCYAEFVRFRKNGDERCRVLTDQLEMEVANTLQYSYLSLAQQVVVRLNSLGHALKPHEPPGLLDYTYRDDIETEGGYNCKLRVAFGGSVIAGWGKEFGAGAKFTVDDPVNMNICRWLTTGLITSRFSAEAFRAAGLDSPKARKLADELATAIHQEVRDLLWPLFRAVIWTLNAMGHRLMPESEITDAEFTFCDFRKMETMYDCHLRLALDTSVSTGYFHPTVLDENGC